MYQIKPLVWEYNNKYRHYIHIAMTPFGNYVIEKYADNDSFFIFYSDGAKIQTLGQFETLEEAKNQAGNHWTMFVERSLIKVL